MLVFAPLFGAVFAYALNPEKVIYYGLFSFVIGTLLYVVVRDMIPYGKKGHLGYFLAGFFANMALLVLVGIIADIPV